MNPWLVLVLVLTFSLSGCADEGGGALEPNSTDPDPDAPVEQDPATPEPSAIPDLEAAPSTPNRYEAKFNLTFRGGHLFVGGSTVVGANDADPAHCVTLMGSGLALLAGGAEATWDPQSPLVESVTLRAFDEGTGDRFAAETGGSGVSIEWTGHQLGEIWIAVHADTALVAVDQVFTLDVWMEYEGEGDVSARTTPCWF